MDDNEFSAPAARRRPLGDRKFRLEAAPGRRLSGAALEALRPLAQRIGRLAEVLFGAGDADVVIPHEGRVWRGRGSGEHDDTAAARLAMAGDDVVWLDDASQSPELVGDLKTLGRGAWRLYVSAPITLKSGLRLGALRVLDRCPRAYDAALVENLKSLASILSDECERLVGDQFESLFELFEQAPGFVAVLGGPDFVYERVNPAYIAMIGDRPLIGQPVATALPEPSGQRFLELLKIVARTGRAHVGQGVSVGIERQPGRLEQRYIDFVLQPIFEGGSVSRIFCQGTDVTFEQKSVSELSEKQYKLEAALSAIQAILDHSLDVICMVSSEGRFTQVSRRAYQVWGYTADELVGRAYMDLVHPDDRETTREKHMQIVQGASTRGFSNRYLHKDGSAVPVMWSAAWSERHQSIFCIARDMRESLAAEERLRQAMKMDAVGRLTGGVAHDFNNLLTIIVGSSETLVDTLEPGTHAHGVAKLTLEAGERGADLVSRLMTFSRAQPLDPTPTNATELLRSLEPLIRRTIGENIVVEVKPQGQLIFSADRVQLDSALLNLAINARDAMPSGGRLKIRTRAVDLSARDVENTTMKAGRYVRFSVEDSGLGMDDRTLERATEPFFTTKDVGKGSGLGLAMVYGFVGQSGGGMRIRSKLARGTIVDLFLPASQANNSTLVARAATAPPPGSATILVVEDDHLVRAHVVRLLREMGYSVVARYDGASALETLRSEEQIDLLLTDIVMPGGMNGRELAHHALILRPGLKVLFTSGYADDEVMSMGPALSPDELLRKPYRREVLRRLVAESLAAQRINPNNE